MWLSLVERLLWEQDAAGSNPVIPTTSSRTMYRSRRLFFWKVIGSLTPSLLLSAKSHACYCCSLVNVLTTPPRRYQLFAGLNLFQNFSQASFSLPVDRSRASTRKSRSGLFLCYGFALASIAGIFFVNVSHIGTGFCSFRFFCNKKSVARSTVPPFLQKVPLRLRCSLVNAPFFTPIGSLPTFCGFESFSKFFADISFATYWQPKVSTRNSRAGLFSLPEFGHSRWKFIVSIPIDT